MLQVYDDGHSYLFFSRKGSDDWTKLTGDFKLLGAPRPDSGKAFSSGQTWDANALDTRKQHGVVTVRTHGPTDYMVSPTGALFETKSFQAPIFWRNAVPVTHKGAQYLLVSTKHEVNGAMKEETFLIRAPDQAQVRIANRYVELEDLSFKLTDGILTVSDFSRHIDLDHFDAERRFVPKTAPQVLDREGKVVDASSEVTKKYPDLVRTAAADVATEDSVIDENELSSIRKAVLKEQKGSVLLLGEPGTGKSEAVRQFAHRVAAGQVPEVPRTWKILQMDPSTLASGTSYLGMIEQRVSELRAASHELPILWWIDEIHGLKGLGAHSSNSNDVAELIKGDMADGIMRVIGASTQEEFNRAFASNPAFIQRFTSVEHREPEGEALRKILRSWMKKRGKLVPEESVLEYMIKLSGQMNAVDAQPRKVLSLVQDVFADLESSGKNQVAPTLADVKRSAQQLYQLDPIFFEPEKMREMARSFPQELEERLVGNREIKREVVSLAKQAFAQVQDPKKPAFRLLLSGTKGTGKTELGYAIAQASRRPYLRIEMNRYASGAVPNELLKEIANQLRKNPFSVIIFDEIEKAARPIQEALIAMMDSGIFTVTEGSTTVRVSARNAFLVSTSNAGSEYIKSRVRSGQGIDPEEFREACRRDGLSEVIMDRQQMVKAVVPPSRSEFREIVALHLRKELAHHAKERGVGVRIANTDKFLDQVTDEMYHPLASGRDAVRVQNVVREALADAVIDGHFDTGKDLVLRYEGGRESGTCLVRQLDHLLEVKP